MSELTAQLDLVERMLERHDDELGFVVEQLDLLDRAHQALFGRIRDEAEARRRVTFAAGALRG